MSSPVADPRRSDFPQHAETLERRSGEHYTMARLGKLSELGRYAVRHLGIGRTVNSKVFLHETLNLTGAEISFGVIPPRTSLPFQHKHRQNEEIYLFLSGSGDYRVDDDVFPIEEGSVVRVAPDGVRVHRNTSDEPMLYVCIQAKAGSLEQWTMSDGVGVPGEATWPDAS